MRTLTNIILATLTMGTLAVSSCKNLNENKYSRIDNEAIEYSLAQDDADRKTKENTARLNTAVYSDFKFKLDSNDREDKYIELSEKWGNPLYLKNKGQHAVDIIENIYGQILFVNKYYVANEVEKERIESEQKKGRAKVMNQELLEKVEQFYFAYESLRVEDAKTTSSDWMNYEINSSKQLYVTKVAENFEFAIYVRYKPGVMVSENARGNFVEWISHDVDKKTEGYGDAKQMPYLLQVATRDVVNAQNELTIALAKEK
jgi:hypothetical protein